MILSVAHAVHIDVVDELLMVLNNRPGLFSCDGRDFDLSLPVVSHLFQLGRLDLLFHEAERFRHVDLLLLVFSQVHGIGLESLNVFLVVSDGLLRLNLLLLVTLHVKLDLSFFFDGLRQLALELLQGLADNGGVFFQSS